MGMHINRVSDIDTLLDEGVTLSSLPSNVIQIANLVNDSDSSMADLCSKNPFTWTQAEKEIIGFTHSEVSARLAKNWQLSPTLVATIAGHHGLSECIHKGHVMSAAIMGIADYTTYQEWYPCSAGISVSLDNVFWETVGFDESDVADVIQKVADSTDAINDLVNL